ncbi:MAG: site-specific integrase [Bacteroidetes bacterium]|nr:site-specific integrase [Bacteroidota bacterium]
MKVNEDLSLLVLLEKSRMTKDGKATIIIRLTVEGKRAEISLGQKVRIENWNQESGTVKGSSQEARLINNAIETARVTIRKKYDALCLDNEFVSATMVKAAYQNKQERTKGLMEAIDLAIQRIAEKVEKKKRAKATLTKWNTTRDKAASFLQHAFRSTDIPLNKITLSFAEDFVDFLMLQQGIESNTANKYLKTIRGVITNVVARGWVANNPLCAYQCSYIEPERDILDENEILILHNKQMPVERLEHVKNAYLFMCFTGFAYKDTSKLTRDNVVTHFDGEQWIVKNRQKVTKAVCRENVPLLPIAKEIIAKYENDPYCIEHNVLLPINSNQKYNAYLKEIADLCGIKKELTTHTARHTFATTVTLANGVPLETVSALLGHKSIKTTQIYAKIVAQKVSADMGMLKERLIVKMPSIMLQRPEIAA